VCVCVCVFVCSIIICGMRTVEQLFINSWRPRIHADTFNVLQFKVSIDLEDFKIHKHNQYMRQFKMLLGLPRNLNLLLSDTGMTCMAVVLSNCTVALRYCTLRRIFPHIFALFPLPPPNPPSLFCTFRFVPKKITNGVCDGLQFKI
jgi:hypothetical protein